MRLFSQECSKVPHLAAFLADPNAVLVYYPVVNTLAFFIPGQITLDKAASLVPTFCHPTASCTLLF